jgi:hypothetical protein
MGKLEGKVALVTGSGRNIGRATVLSLCNDFPMGELRECETPDFLVVAATGRKIGIEITQASKTSEVLTFDLFPGTRLVMTP